MTEKDFDAVYREYFDPVFRYCLSLTPDRHRAEEIAQETFFRALQSIDRYRGDSSVRTWLCAIAKHVFLSEERKKKSVPLDSIPEKADDAKGPEELAVAGDESARLHRLLHDLPEPYKEVFSLRVFAQLGFREIGSLFGKTENWACVVFYRARKKLHETEDVR